MAKPKEIVVRILQDLSFEPRHIYPNPRDTVVFVNDSDRAVRICYVPEDVLFDEHKGEIRIDPSDKAIATVQAQARHIGFSYRSAFIDEYATCDAVWISEGIRVAVSGAIYAGTGGKGSGGGTTGP